MAQPTTSAPQQQVAMPAVDLRQMYGSVVAFEGIARGTDFGVNQRAAGANMSVDVGPGTAAIQDDHATGGGMYSATLTATSTNVTVTGADPTNPRIDRVVIRVRDQALGDSTNDVAPVIVAGTATAGATLANLNGAATVPASSLLVANILVPAASSSVTNANIDTTVRRILNEPDYVQIVAPVTVSGTSGAQTTVITGTPVTYDGTTTVYVEFFAPIVATGNADSVTVELYDGATSQGVFGVLTANAAGAAVQAPMTLETKITPTAASHTYIVKAYRTTNNGSITAGTGGAGQYRPAYLRVKKA